MHNEVKVICPKYYKHFREATHPRHLGRLVSGTLLVLMFGVDHFWLLTIIIIKIESLFCIFCLF